MGQRVHGAGRAPAREPRGPHRVTAPGARSAGRVAFQGGGRFYTERKARVDALLGERGRARRAQRRMYAKSAVMLAWLAGSWVGLVFVAETWWQGALLVVSLGLALAGVAFNMWLLYGLFAIKWHTMGGFGYLREGRIGDIPVRWPRGAELAGFWHHLFSRVCHIHSPAIAVVGREVCEAHGVRHLVPGPRPALASHARWLREMGAGTGARGRGRRGDPRGQRGVTGGVPGNVAVRSSRPLSGPRRERLTVPGRPAGSREGGAVHDRQRRLSRALA